MVGVPLSEGCPRIQVKPMIFICLNYKGYRAGHEMNISDNILRNETLHFIMLNSNLTTTISHHACIKWRQKLKSTKIKFEKNV